MILHGIVRVILCVLQAGALAGATATWCILNMCAVLPWLLDDVARCGLLEAAWEASVEGGH